MALGYGSRGPQVKELQQQINDAGYTPPLVVDGIWGPKTQAGNEWLNAQNSEQEPQASGVRKQYAQDSRFFGLGGEPEIWYNSDTGEWSVVYFAPGSKPPLPIHWTIPDDTTLESYFGPNNEPVADRVITTADLTSVGAVPGGTSLEIPTTTTDPLIGLAERIDRDKAVRPYLNDPEVVAIIVASAIEGTAPSTTDLQQTDWYQNHTAAEKQWLLLSASDPKTAKQALESQRIVMAQSLKAAGINNATDDLVNFMADKVTTGAWDQNYATAQLSAISDPYAGIAVDEELSAVVGDLETPLNVNTDEESWVREQALTWLGPVFGSFTDNQIAQIAGRVRNDPNYRDEWIDSLKQQRLAMFPQYTDMNASYDEIAQPWRQVYTSVLGGEADETSDQFQNLVQSNDLTAGKKALRMYGLETGNEKVTNDFLSALSAGASAGVRGVF